MISNINLIIIIFLIVLIILLLNKLFPNKLENFHPFFRDDQTLGYKINELNEQKKLNSQSNYLTELNMNQQLNLDEIESVVNKYDTVIKIIRENINNIPVCREIDLKPQAKPDCSERAGELCTLNPYCKLEIQNNDDGINRICVNKQLRKECEDILEVDENNNYTGRATKFFIYPTVLNEITR